MATKINFTTTEGVAMYPWLNKPDTQFDANGQFKVNLRVSNDNAKEMKKLVMDAAKEAFGEAKAKTAQLPFKKDEETGDVVIVTKSKFRPKVADGTGKLINDNNVPPIHGGSTLKLSGNVYPYTAGGRHGVSLQLGAVQLIQLAEGSNASASFAPVEGAYVAPDMTQEEDSYDF